MAEDYKKLQSMMLSELYSPTKGAAWRKSILSEAVDDATGAPYSERARWAVIQDPNVRLDTVRKYHPEAIAVPEHPNNFIIRNPNYDPKKPASVFNRPLMLTDPSRFEAGDVAEGSMSIPEIAGGIVGAFAGATAGTAAGGPVGGVLGADVVGALGAEEARLIFEMVIDNFLAEHPADYNNTKRLLQSAENVAIDSALGLGISGVGGAMKWLGGGNIIRNAIESKLNKGRMSGEDWVSPQDKVRQVYDDIRMPVRNDDGTLKAEQLSDDEIRAIADRFKLDGLGTRYIASGSKSAALGESFAAKFPVARRMMQAKVNNFKENLEDVIHEAVESKIPQEILSWNAPSDVMHKVARSTSGIGEVFAEQARKDALDISNDGLNKILEQQLKIIDVMPAHIAQVSPKELVKKLQTLAKVADEKWPGHVASEIEKATKAAPGPYQGGDKAYPLKDVLYLRKNLMQKMEEVRLGDEGIKLNQNKYDSYSDMLGFLNRLITERINYQQASKKDGIARTTKSKRLVEEGIDISKQKDWQVKAKHYWDESKKILDNTKYATEDMLQKTQARDSELAFKTIMKGKPGTIHETFKTFDDIGDYEGDPGDINELRTAIISWMGTADRKGNPTDWSPDNWFHHWDRMNRDDKYSLLGRRLDPDPDIDGDRIAEIKETSKLIGEPFDEDELESIYETHMVDNMDYLAKLWKRASKSEERLKFDSDGKFDTATWLISALGTAGGAFANAPAVTGVAGTALAGRAALGMSAWATAKLLTSKNGVETLGRITKIAPVLSATMDNETIQNKLKPMFKQILIQANDNPEIAVPLLEYVSVLKDSIKDIGFIGDAEASEALDIDDVERILANMSPEEIKQFVNEDRLRQSRRQEAKLRNSQGMMVAP